MDSIETYLFGVGLKFCVFWILLDPVPVALLGVSCLEFSTSVFLNHAMAETIMIIILFIGKWNVTSQVQEVLSYWCDPLCIPGDDSPSDPAPFEAALGIRCYFWFGDSPNALAPDSDPQSDCSTFPSLYGRSPFRHSWEWTLAWTSIATGISSPSTFSLDLNCWF